VLILRSSPASPFGRKVKIAAKITGTYDRFRIEPANTMDPGDTLRQQNPLGKLPALILEDNTVLYDSRVICEHLDSLHVGPSIFPDGAARWPALTLQALADGIMDAGLLLVYEKRYRPDEFWHAPWMEMQQEKVDRALAALEGAPPALPKSPHIGHIALACALGYLDFRFAGRWRDTNTDLTGWLEAFENSVPAFAETAPRD